MKRIQALDVFRGFAALSVILYHYTTQYRSLYQYPFPDYADFTYGYLGVQFFFIISGFVIFMTVNQSNHWGEFLYRRFSRLYPTFWFCLIVTILSVRIMGLPGRETSLKATLINFTMLPKAFGVPSVDGAYWSLLPEFFFYLLMAFLMGTNQVRKTHIWCSIWLLIILLANLLPFPSFIKGLLNTRYGMYFIMGIMFYLIKTKEDKSVFPHVMIILCYLTTFLVRISYLEEILIGSIVLIFYLFVYEKMNWTCNKALIFLGRISFPLYLLHQNLGYIIMNFCRPFFRNGSILIIFPPIIISIALATLVHFFVEKPSQRFLRNKFHSPQVSPI